MSTTVCVIGSNSFSGASYCKFLLEQGYQVIGISRSLEPVDALLPYSWVNGANKVNFFQLDINHDLAQIENLFDKLKPSHIYNFAAQSMVGQSWDYPEHWFMTNVVSTIKLHNMLRYKDYLDKYIHISTPEVYGICSGYIDESQVFNPSTPYAVSRAAADMSLKTFFDVHQFPVISTRAANVYGEGQQLYRIIPRTILYIILGKKLSLHGGGHSERSFIHIDDVSNATLLSKVLLVIVTILPQIQRSLFDNLWNWYVKKCQLILTRFVKSQMIAKGRMPLIYLIVRKLEMN